MNERIISGGENKRLCQVYGHEGKLRRGKIDEGSPLGEMAEVLGDVCGLPWQVSCKLW